MSSQAASPRQWRYRTWALVFAGGVLVGLAGSELIRTPRAEAQIPDPAVQRRSTFREALETNRLLKDMLDVLRNGTLKVRVVEEDKPAKPRAKKPVVKP